MYIKRLFCFFVFLLAVLSVISAKAKTPLYPKLVEELTMPSGFNNDYVLKLKNKESVDFIKPVLRIGEIVIPESFYYAIKTYDYDLKDILKSKIASTGRYILLSTDEDLKTIFKEQSKVGDDNFDDNSDVELGSLKIASYLLNAKITQSFPIVKQEGGYFKLTVSVGAAITINNTTKGIIEYTNNIVATKSEDLFVTSDGMIIKGPRNLTNKPINTINANGKDIDLSPQYYEALDDAINKIIYFIEEKYPIMGEVLEFKKDNVTTTISQKNGVKIGDFVFIIRMGDPLTDSSGKFLGFSKTMIGAAQITSIENSMSTAKIIKLQDKKILPSNHDIVITLPLSVK